MKDRRTPPGASHRLRVLSKEPISFDGANVPTKTSASPLQLVDKRSNDAARLRMSLDDIKKSPEAQGRIRNLFGSMLTKRHAGELVSKIREGYYLNPHIVHAVAVVICTVLENEA